MQLSKEKIPPQRDFFLYVGPVYNPPLRSKAWGGYHICIIYQSSSSLLISYMFGHEGGDINSGKVISNAQKVGCTQSTQTIITDSATGACMTTMTDTNCK